MNRLDKSLRDHSRPSSKTDSSSLYSSVNKKSSDRPSSSLIKNPVRKSNRNRTKGKKGQNRSFQSPLQAQNSSSYQSSTSKYQSFISPSLLTNLSSLPSAESHEGRVLNRLLTLELELGSRLNKMKEQKITMLQKYNREYDRFINLSVSQPQPSREQQLSQSQNSHSVGTPFLQASEANEAKLKNALTESHELKAQIDRKLEDLDINRQNQYDLLAKFYRKSAQGSISNSTLLGDSPKTSENVKIQKIAQIVRLQEKLSFVSKHHLGSSEQRNLFISHQSMQSIEKVKALNAKLVFLKYEIQKIDRYLSQIRSSSANEKSNTRKHWEMIEKLDELKQRFSQSEKQKIMANHKDSQQQQSWINNEEKQEKQLLFEELSRKKQKYEKICLQNKIMKILIQNYKS